jgi:glycosyltransferase 2 family protein
MGAIVAALLPGPVGYPMVLGVLLLSAVATAIAHIPAGIGVLEAVFLALLGGRIAEAPLLAALLAYRAFYYLVPLLLAVVVFLLFEARAGVDRPGPGSPGREDAARIPPPR